MAMNIVVRKATVADAQAIAHVHILAWREAYAHLVPADALAGLDEEQRAGRWAEILAAPGTAVWLADDGGTTVGWASSVTGRNTDAPTQRELNGLYVLASHQGTGAGQALLDAAVGLDPAYLWVAQDNPRAQAFYQRNGFAPDGATDTHTLAGTPVPCVRMVR